MIKQDYIIQNGNKHILAEAHIPAIKRKGLIDKIAAGIILQNYLNSKK